MEKKKAKGLPIDECVRRASRYISEQGMCLLLFDVKGSRNFPESYCMEKKLEEMADDINCKFSGYLPENSLAGKLGKGFSIFRGDSGIGCINSVDAVREISDYQKARYGEISLYWSVAKDSDDREGFSWIV